MERRRKAMKKVFALATLLFVLVSGIAFGKEPINIVGTWRGNVQAVGPDEFFETEVVIVVTEQQGALFKGDMNIFGTRIAGVIRGKKISITMDNHGIISGQINRTGTNISFVLLYLADGNSFNFRTGTGVIVKD